MRRADRLFRIVQRLRRRGVTTARALAEDLQVSERTIYRDVRDLVLSGVPVLGEAGVGYALPRGYELPPLMFTEEPQLRAAAGDVLAKVEAVLPPALRDRLSAAQLFAPTVHVPAAVTQGLERLRAALRERRKIRFRYVDRRGASSERTIWPLGLFFWGTSWSVAGYCELRKDFRNFRADRVAGLEVLSERFEEVEGRTLRDLLEHYQEEEAHAP